MRVLAPYGVAHLAGDRIVKPYPDEMDEWTHFRHSAEGNMVAQDTVVGPPCKGPATFGGSPVRAPHPASGWDYPRAQPPLFPPRQRKPSTASRQSFPDRARKVLLLASCYHGRLCRNHRATPCATNFAGRILSHCRCRRTGPRMSDMRC
jgi:hypothetical protein